MDTKINFNNEFWKIRSKKYNNLQWVNHHKYLDTFVKAGRFKKSDTVLDVGTGTGIVAHSISPFVKEVIGLDHSQDMLEHSNWYGNMYFIRRDIRDAVFADKVFDKVTCRQVFHHIMKYRIKAMSECYRVLKKGGFMILAEGVPPTKRVKKDYIEIFKLKEKRVTFYEEDLFDLMDKACFKDITATYVNLEKMSVKNWLNNSGLSRIVQEEIYKLHKNAGDYFKSDYNMIEKNNDCFIDMKMIILIGKK